MGFPDRVHGREFDLVVIGGGINGAGVARDAALRGLDVLLVEKNDFASGTSSRSTKLVHGGLRYLEHYELGLVFESLRERSVLNRIASHLVTPRPFLFPIFKSGSLPAWKLRLGLTVYDLLSLFRGFGNHRFLSVDQARRRFPAMAPRDLTGAGLYFDCQMDDARLVLENVLDADRHGATVRNYCEVTSVDEVSGRDLRTVTVLDGRSGEQCSVRTHRLVNATGPWSDRVARHWRDSEQTNLRPTRGSHLVLPPVETDVAGFFPSVRDDRLMFIIPWLGKTLVGTTDTEFGESPDNVRVTDEDRNYLLDNANAHLVPDFSPDDIHAEFAGLRPLYDPSGGDGPPGAVSRDHEILCERGSIYSIVGGKYTTYRAIAEETMNTMDAPGTTQTARDRLPGGWADGESPVEYRDELREIGDLSEDQAIALTSRYGRRIRELIDVAEQVPNGWEPLGDSGTVLKAEIHFAVSSEYARFPRDFVRRRTNLFTNDSVNSEEIEMLWERVRDGDTASV